MPIPAMAASRKVAVTCAGLQEKQPHQGHHKEDRPDVINILFPDPLAHLGPDQHPDERGKLDRQQQKAEQVHIQFDPVLGVELQVVLRELDRQPGEHVDHRDHDKGFIPESNSQALNETRPSRADLALMAKSGSFVPKKVMKQGPAMAKAQMAALMAYPSLGSWGNWLTMMP